jgi:glycosyltransferase involved in cell wall biosynthesis
VPAVAAGLRPALCVIGANHPSTGGATPFNAALVAALRELGPTQFLSWSRLYPPLGRHGERRVAGAGAGRVASDELLDYLNPLTWRAALARLRRFGARALVLPWLHPVAAPPYRHLLRNAPRGVARVVICHNVLPHERVPLAERAARSVLRHADVLVTHAPQQRDELAALGLAGPRVLESFHPRFVAADLAPPPAPAAVAAERARQGSPALALLCFGAVRPYKGVDLALDALARVDPALRVRLVVAGAFWDGGSELRAQVGRLGLHERVELREGYVSDEHAAVLFAACDAVLLPYRAASQSGVVQLAFAHGRPVLATAVGGLPAAVRDGVDGLLCAPEPAALARAIERLAREHATLRAGVEAAAPETSFRRYAELLYERLEAG